MLKITTKTKDNSLFQMVPKKTRAKADTQFKSAPFYLAGGEYEFGDKKFPVKDFNSEPLKREDVVCLGEIMETIYPKSAYNPSRLGEVNEELIDTDTEIKYVERDNPKLKASGMVACVMKEWRNKFKIYIHEDVELEAYDSADVHEKGHVLFNHLSGSFAYLEQFKKELEKIWDSKLTKYFDDDVIKLSKTKIVKMLFREFSNIAQDMEINSKLFDNGEWVKCKKTLSRAAVRVSFAPLLAQFDELSGMVKNVQDRALESPGHKKLVNKFMFILCQLLERIDGEEGDFQFCYPANKGWPEKMDWMTYMIFLVNDIDNTMGQVMNQIAKQIQKPMGGGKTMSQSVLQEYFDSVQKEIDAQNSANSDAGIDGGNVDVEGRSDGGDGRCDGSKGVAVDFETCDTFSSFTAFLRKECLGKKNRRLNSDVLYNSNRGKFSQNVVVPRRHLIEKWMQTECHIVVDISGSVPTDYVERVINSIVDTNSGIDLKNSHIIFCDTEVVSDEIMSSRTKSVYAGGGTNIAQGIKYVGEKKYCSKKNDKLFVISDFQDKLSRWVDEAEKFPGLKYAIGYNVRSREDCEGMFASMQNGNDINDSEVGQRWNRAFHRTIFITETI